MIGARILAGLFVGLAFFFIALFLIAAWTGPVRSTDHAFAPPPFAIPTSPQQLIGLRGANIVFVWKKSDSAADGLAAVCIVPSGTLAVVMSAEGRARNIW
jgi:hypothetical protein